MADASDVRDAALLELGVDYTLYNLADDSAFQAYALAIAEGAIEDMEDRFSTFDLDDNATFDAVTFETCSRLLRRLVNQFFANILFAEELKIGPIEISPARNSAIAPMVKALADDYHQKAESAVSAAGGATRKGAIRNWTPRCRNTYI